MPKVLETKKRIEIIRLQNLGEKDTKSLASYMIHAAENMIWLYENIIGVERTEFKRADFDERIHLFFDKMKHEAADTSVQR